MDRRCRTGEIENLIDLHEQGMGDVVAKELEGLVTEQMLDIASRAGEEIVDAENLATGIEQTVAKMRA